MTAPAPLETRLYEAVARGETASSFLPVLLSALDADAVVLHFLGDAEASVAFRHASLGLLEELKVRLVDALRAAGAPSRRDFAEPELALVEDDFARLVRGETAAEISVFPVAFGGEVVGGLAVAAREKPAPPSELLAALGIARRIESARREDAEAEDRFARLASVGKVFAEGLSLDRTLTRLLEIAVDLAGADAGLVARAGAPILPPITWGLPPEWGAGIRLRNGTSLFESLFRDPQPRLFPSLSDLDPADLPEALESLAAFPLEYEGEALGVLLIANPSERFFTSALERRSLAALAAIMGGAVRQARLVEAEIQSERLREEVRLAGRVQASLLPARLPANEDVRMAAVMEPARHVGGDFYDVLSLGPRRYGIVVGDVAGKGLTGAMLMATSRAYLRAFAADGAPPGEVFARMNRALLADFGDDKFLTAVYLILDCKSRRLQSAGAGHHPLLLRRSDGTVEEIPAGGFPLGLFDGGDFSLCDRTLEPGASLLIFTDGLLEAASPDGTFFGIDRVRATFSELGGESPEEVVTALRDEVRDFTRAKGLSDDFTVVAVRVP